MYNKVILYLGSLELPLTWLLLAAGYLGAMALLCAGKKSLPRRNLLFFGVLAAILGLLLGRGVYCAVRWYEIFLDELGDPRGIQAFFDTALGSANVMGIFAGLLLAAPVTAALTKTRPADYLDAAVLPALALYAFARAVEPLSGQGNGSLIGMDVCVAWVETVLTLSLMALLPVLRRRSAKPGTLAQYAMTLWCLTQILPESLRCDNALYVFVFARVTHLGLAFTLGLTLIRLLIVEGRRGLEKKAIALDVVGLAAGIGICIATIFALDKTNLPKPLVYGVMLLSLAELGYVILRRIRLTDQRA